MTMDRWYLLFIIRFILSVYVDLNIYCSPPGYDKWLEHVTRPFEWLNISFPSGTLAL